MAKCIDEEAITAPTSLSSTAYEGLPPPLWTRKVTGAPQHRFRRYSFHQISYSKVKQGNRQRINRGHMVMNKCSMMDFIIMEMKKILWRINIIMIMKVVLEF